MKIYKQKWIQLLIVIVILVQGCGLSQFQAQKYVKAVLDATYLEDFDSYLEITNSDKESAESYFEEGMRKQAECYASYFGVDAISDATSERLASFAKQIYTYSRYTVKKEKKNGGDYEVIVSIEPIAFSKLASDEVRDYIDEFNQRAEDGEFLNSSDAIYQERFVEGLLDVYKKHLDEISYLEKEEVRVTLSLNKDGVYEMNDDGFVQIDELLIEF